MLIVHVKPVVIWFFRRIKYLIEVIRIKMFALNAEVPFDRFRKELRFVSVCLGDFVVVAQCWIIALTLWLEEVLDFAPRLTWIDLLADTECPNKNAIFFTKLKTIALCSNAKYFYILKEYE